MKRTLLMATILAVPLQSLAMESRVCSPGEKATLVCDPFGKCWYECQDSSGFSRPTTATEGPNGPNSPGGANKGNHYGNDKQDNNPNDSKNKHDGENSKGDHHDNNGGGKDKK